MKTRLVYVLVGLMLMTASTFRLATDPWIQRQLPHAEVATASPTPKPTPTQTPHPSARPLNEAAAAYIAAAARVVAAESALADAVAANVEAAKAASEANPGYNARVAAEAASGICQGNLSVALFSPVSGIDQSVVDRHQSAYLREGQTCDEVTYLGSVIQIDSTDFIYRVIMKGKASWFIFTVTNGLITNIQ